MPIQNKTERKEKFRAWSDFQMSLLKISTKIS